MNEAEALEAAILATPEDFAPRAVYSDWLRERGDEEFADMLIDPELQDVPMKMIESLNWFRMWLHDPTYTFSMKPYYHIQKALIGLNKMPAWEWVSIGSVAHNYKTPYVPDHRLVIRTTATYANLLEH